MAEYATVKIEVSRHARLAAIADLQNNSMSNTLENLIDNEYARIFSRPNPGVTVQQATTAEEILRREG